MLLLFFHTQDQYPQYFVLMELLGTQFQHEVIEYQASRQVRYFDNGIVYCIYPE